MNACALEVLHDTRDEDVVAVTDGIDLDLAAHHVLIDQNWVLNLVAGDNLHELADIGLLVGNLHALTAQNVGRTNENRIAKLVQPPSTASSSVITVWPAGRGIPHFRG